MAIIALIATPLVMSIIRKARISADKRSVDAYGRSVELAIVGYLMDTGSFPTSIEQLTIEYSGDEVVCSTTQLNFDSSVYLAGCTVAGRSVENYTYGSDKSPTYTAYSVGDEVTYNNINYYVIKDSSASEDSVTLLKAEPLSVEEVNQFGVGHVNRYTRSSVGTADDYNGYGRMAYYTSEDCGYINNNWVNSGCTTNYTDSDIKYVVDAWKNAQAPMATEPRLITLNDLTENLAYVLDPEATSESYIASENTPSWVYQINYIYWTMSTVGDSVNKVWIMDVVNGRPNDNYDITGYYAVVRPVIVLPKSAID